MTDEKKPTQGSVQVEQEQRMSIPISAGASTIELWGRSRHNGTWFPVHVWPINVAATSSELWDQFEVMARYTGQMCQCNNTDPSGCLSSTPQAAEPLQDLNTLTDGSPARGVSSDNETVTVLAATGQENSS